MSYMKYALILTASSLMVGCVAASPKLTATEIETKNELSASQYQSAPREIRDNIETQQVLAQAAFWSHEYNLNPSDLEAAIKFSTTLRKLGNPARAVEVTRTTRALYPRDPYLNAEHAAALIANQQTRPAMKILDMALKDAPSYGRLWSLKGVALDQMEKYAEARPFYDRALRITPNDPNIMANLGLNFALAGDPHTAHQWLSRAAAHPDASESVYANLELVEGYMAQVAPQGAPRPTAHASRQPSAPSYSQPQAPQAAQPHYGAASNYAPRQANPIAPSAAPSALPRTQYRPQAQQYVQQAPQFKPAAAPQSEETVPTSQNVLARIARNVGPKTAPAPTYGQRPQNHDTNALPSYVAPYEGVPYNGPSSAQPHDPNRVAQNQAPHVEQLPQIRGGYPAPQTPYYDNAPQQQSVQRRGASRQR